jgi:hypothetical protein
MKSLRMPVALALLALSTPAMADEPKPGAQPAATAPTSAPAEASKPETSKVEASKPEAKKVAKKHGGKQEKTTKAVEATDAAK